MIRRAMVSDFAAVHSTLLQAGLPTDDIPTASELLVWIADADGQCAGVVGLERFGIAALLRSLAVVPTHRGRGLGHDLVTHAEQEARALGIEQLVLLTETAQPFFSRLGYRLLDRRDVSPAVKESAEFRSLCPASAVCMSKAL